MPSYSPACVLVPLAYSTGNGGNSTVGPNGQALCQHSANHNPKQAGSKGYGHYAVGNAAFALHGGACTVAQYMAYCATPAATAVYRQATGSAGNAAVPTGAQISWHVRAGMWALVPAPASPAYPHLASK
jgi:hypothetical protein